MAIEFDVAVFRARYSQFSDSTAYSSTVLSGYWDVASCFVSTEDYGYLRGDCRATAIMLMTAHIAQLSTMAASGDTAGVMNSATVDKVSISLTPPPVASQLAWWMNLTPYGSQLAAMLNMLAVGGMFVGGSRTRSAFRGPSGYFI